MYVRKRYLDKIIPFINKPVIKVITGMRRVGKSCFLQQIKGYLLSQGVNEQHIIEISMESLDFEFISDYKVLHEYISEKLDKEVERYTILIDEVQEIEGWEKAILSFFKEGTFDIYITGSNAHLLSSELATFISGRYIEFPIYPLSFKEFCEFRIENSGAKEEQFQTYLKFGGLPGIQHFISHENETFQYIEAIYETVLLKDIVQRFNIRNVSTLQKISHFIFDNIGNLFSAKKIADYLKSQKIQLSVDTVQNYAQYLQDAFLIHKASRYDIKGKKTLEINEKYYLNDLGLRHAAIGYKDMDIAALLENVVYLELLRRGYSVSIGKIGDKEIDFIASHKDRKIYIQVSYILDSQKTKEREISAFKNIDDHFPRLLLTLDKIQTSSNINGIELRNIIDFLLDDEF